MEHLSQETMRAEISAFNETLETLRDLRMQLILDIYMEDVIKSEIQHKVHDEYSAVFDEAKLYGFLFLFYTIRS